MKNKTVIRITVFVLGVFFVIGGSIIANEKGIPLLFEADKLVNTLECDNGLACSGRNVHHKVLYDGHEIGQLSGHFTFLTPYAFIINEQIKYEFSIKVPSPEITDRLLFLIMASDGDYENLTTLSYTQLTEKFGNKGLVELTKLDDGTFHNGLDNGYWSYPVKATFTVMPIISINGELVYLGESDILFETEERSAKIKAIDQHDEKIGNKQILALTWIGIAIAPILLGIDLVVRAVLRE